MPLKDLGFIEEASAEQLEELQRDAEDIAWWNEHAHELEVKYRGKYLTVINKELFVGDTYDEVYDQVKAQYPDEEPFIDYIPYKKEILVL
ncbi:MAG: DUF5678 domain-containing protein [Chloroflexota bacterium]|nr:DUF5678 domain-containing protein [Chloroflexota bacterium]